MPNWCENKMTVVGKPDDVKAFYERYADEGTKLSLNRITPRPQELDDWYQWSVDNWGTKWDVEADGEVAESDWMHDVPASQVQYSFESAWGPPLEAVKTLIARHPELVFAIFYNEPGMCFHGWLTGAKGKVETDKYIDGVPHHDTAWLANDMYGGIVG